MSSNDLLVWMSCDDCGAVAEPDGDVRSMGGSQPIGIDPEAGEKLGAAHRCGSAEDGPTNWDDWELTALGVKCSRRATLACP
jgi:hypothetical protein